ncbi:hypothetical protein [Mesorhizobium sp. ZC-5]|uniref:hypothetical protein n=1 Tax=Mesorhizobium sp. ZC-5 TaxID=2986066 RepID=UPI0021E887F7|nr:hypothetical protein [Mesorhizobium sp. ZC-5]MCV3238434.1 hypothetical protein [Mesorhizobium sp. ZC-5]
MYSAKVTRQTQSKKSIESGESRSSRHYRSEFSRHLWKTSALSTIALAGAGAAHAQDALWQPQVQTIVGGDHQGAYSSLEGFIPLTQTPDSVVFLDLRLKHDFSEGTGGDVGLGLRRVVNPDLILGGYAYLNVERLDGHQFTGATLGVEAIATNFDAHVNVHLPFGDQERETSTSASSLSLVGNQLLEQISVLNRRDYASWGVEGEFGVQAPIDLPKDHALRLHIGGYHFEDAGNTADSVTGGKAGFEYKVGNVLGDSGASLTFGGEVRYDDRDDTTFAGFARLTIPLGGTQRVADGDREPLYNVSEGLRKRANERVRGDIGVRLDTDETAASLSRLAINVRTGSEFGLFFFADGENTLGLGTLGDPTTLDDAVTKAGSGFVVALGGSGNLLTGGVTLTNGQTVIGGGQTVQAILLNGTISSFAFGGSDGTIQGTNPANPVLSLGNGNTLQGITVTGGEVGILGNNINGATLTGVTVDGTGSHGASFTGTSTGINASNFSATDNGGDGLHIEGDGTYNFTGATLLSGNAVDGLSITGNGTYNFQTVNALNNTDDGIEVTSATGTFKTTGGTISGNGDVGVKIDPINANVVLTSITHSRGTSGVILDDVTGSFTVTGATTISNTSGAAIAISNSPASIRFADITIINPGADAITFAGINGPVVVGGVVISGLGTGATGLDFSGSRTTFTAQSVNITGTGAAGSTGIDLSGTQVGSAITVSNGGTIANVDTGVRLGIAGSLANTANANFSFGGGSVGGITASLDARGLNPLTGTYAFGSTVFNGPQLFSTANIVFVGSTATGAGDGSSVNDLATIGTADANAGADAIFVLINDGSVINDADGFTLGDGQTLASFGNGAEYALGGVPLNVTGDNVQNGVVQGDPTGNGAATLTNLSAGNTVVLGDGTVIANITISNGAGGVGIFGDNIDGATLTGVTVSGASFDGASFTGTSTNVGGLNFTSTGNGGAGLVIESDGVFSFSGTTTLSGNAVDGLTIFGDGDYSFETLNIQNNAGSGLSVFATTRASLSIAGGSIAGNDDTAAFISGTDLDVTLDSITHDNPAAGLGGLLLLDVGGSFAVTGATTIKNVGFAGILIGLSTADISFGGPVLIDGVVGGDGLAIEQSGGTVRFDGAVDIGSAAGIGLIVRNSDATVIFDGPVAIADTGEEGIVLNHNTGAVSFDGATAVSRAGFSGIVVVDNTGSVEFGDTTVADPGESGVDVIGVNGTINFGDIDVTGLDAICGCDAAGLNLAGSRSTFTAASLDVSGNNSAGTTGVDLSGTTGGSVTITNGGTIANVDTGVQLGTNGVGGATASTDFVFGGGSIEGLTASLDARGLNPLAGSYAFGATVFNGPQLFDSSNIIFVGSAATGAGDGTSVNDLAAIGTADANTDSGAVFVLVNDGAAVDDADGFTLDDGQTLASFGNGAQYALGGVPLNVTGANVVHGFIQDDPTGNGAATLTNLGAGDTVVLGDGTIIADIDISNGVGGVGILGDNIDGLTLTGVVVTGAGLHGASFTGTTTNVSGSNFTSTGNGGSGLLIDSDGTFNFTGATLLSNNADFGLTIFGDGVYTFDTLNALNNGILGIEVISAGGGAFQATGGTISGNTVGGIAALGADLDLVLTSLSQDGGLFGAALAGVSGEFVMTGATTVANTSIGGLQIADSTANITFGSVDLTNVGLGGGIAIQRSAGVVTFDGPVSIDQSASVGIGIDDSTGPVTFAGRVDISRSAQAGISLGFLADNSGAITFGGPVTIDQAGTVGIGIDGSTGPVTFAGPVDITRTFDYGIALGWFEGNSGAVTFGDVTIDQAFGGISVADANGTITFGNVDITGMEGGAGLDLALSSSTFTAASLDVTGTNVAGSAGIDLSATLGGSVTITNGGTIADVDTGVQMGTNGIGGATANTDFTFGGGSIEGITASLDMRGLDAASGTYSFGATTLTGPQLFDAAGVVFVGRVSTGAGDGSTINDLIAADLADDLGLGANTVFVLVGTAPAEVIDTDADGFTLAAGQSLVSFANGATVDIGGPPANVTGTNVVTGATLDDPFLQGAPTLNNAAGNTIDLSDGNVIANLIATSGFIALDGSGITGLNSSGVVIRGAATGAFLDGALGTITINNLDVQGPVQTGIVLANSAATVNFTGTTQIAGGTIAGLRVDNFDGTADFANLDITGGNLGIGILNGSSGTLTFGTGSSVVNTSGIAVSVGGSTATVNYNGTITQNNAASAVRVDAMTGGSVNFGGVITANTGAANAIDLTGNTGSAINFSGGLNLNTDGGFAFRAVDGGTLTVTGGSNTISTGAGVSENGMTIGGTGMTIGAGGVNFASVTVDGSGGATQTGINIQNTSGGPVTFGSVDISSVAAATGIAIRLSNVTGAYTFNGTTTIDTTGEFTSGLVVENSAINLTVANLVTTSVFRHDVALTNNTGTITISDGTIANSGTGDGVVVSGGSATISVGADITNAGFSSTAAVRVDGITGGSAAFTGTLSATAGGDLFRIGNTTALTGGEVSFSGASLTATGGGGGVVGALGAGAVFDASAPLSITGGALVVQNVAGSATFGSVTMSGGTGIGLSGNAGTLTFGTTNVALGAFPNTSGIRFSGTNTDVTFGQTTITGVGTDQTGINFTGSETTAIFGVTSITGTGALTGRGIDLSSTLNNRAISFATGSSITNIGIGVDLSRGLTTATTANANFTFGDGEAADANGRNSTISAVAGGFTVNAVGLDPASGTYDFDDVAFTGNANLPPVANAVILVSQGGGFINAGTFGLSQTVSTISVAAAQALSGTETFAFVGAIDLSALGTAFTLDAGQSITGFGNGNAVSTGVEQPANVSGDLGGFGGNVTADEAVVGGGANDMFQLYGDNEIRHTTFDFTGGGGAMFFIDGADAAFNNSGITIEGVTIQDVAVGNFAFETTGLQSSLSILNNDINIAGQLISLSGGTAGNVSITRGTLPNGATPGVLTSSGVSASNFGGSASFTGMTVSGTAGALNAIDINQTSNTGTFNFTGLNIGSFAGGATGNGIDIDASGSGGVNLNLISGNSVTSPGDGLHVRHTAAAAAVALSLDNTTWQTMLAGSQAVDVLSSTPNSTYVTSLDANTVTANGIGGGMVFNQVTFDADGNPGTADIVSAGGTTNIGQGTLANQRVQGAGLSFINVSGNLSYDSLNIFNNAGTGLEVDTKTLGTTFTLAVNSGGAGDANIDTTGGMALLLDPLTVDMEFDSITATGGTNGILFDQVDGTFAVTGNTSITGTTGFGISAINTNTGTFSFNAVTIDNDAVGNGGGIGWASGALTTSGLVAIDTTSGAGVSQSGGSTAFSGGLDIQTGSGTGFNATGGSIAVAASGLTESILTATGQILNWTNATVGAGGVSFETLSTSGVVAAGDGILLSNVDGGSFTGGNVTVAGTAAGDGIEISGGSSTTFNFVSATIDNTAAHGINLTGANGAVTFTTVNIDGAAGSGLSIANSTAGVTVGGGSIGPATAASVAIASQVSGTIALNGLTVSANGADAYSLTGNAGTINVTGGSATQSGSEDVFDINSGGATGVVTISAAITHSGATGQAVEIDGTAGNVTFSGNVIANAGAQLFNIGTTTAPTAGTIAFSGTSLTATNGGNAVIAGLGAGATLNISAAVSVTGAAADGLSISGAAGDVTFGAITINTSTGDGIQLGGNSGTLSLGATTIGLGASANTAGLNITGTNASVTFGNVDITGVGASQRGVDLRTATGNIQLQTLDIAGVTPVAAGSVGIDLTGNANTLTFETVDSGTIENVAIGVDLTNANITGRFQYGDGSNVDPDLAASTIDATTPIVVAGLNAASGPYDFLDVNLVGDTSSLSVNAFWVQDGATGIGTRNDPGSIAAAQLSGATYIVLLDAAGAGQDIISLAGGTFNLGAGQSILSFRDQDTFMVAGGAPANVLLFGITTGLIDNPNADGSGAPLLTSTAVGGTLSLAAGSVVDGLVISNNGAGFGIVGTGISADIRNSTITGGTAGGISLTNAGVINAVDVDISGASALQITGGSAAISFDSDSSIANTSGTAVSIANRGGGSFAFGGTVASNGALAGGISVTGATAANTITFSGTVNLGTTTAIGASTGININNNNTTSTVNFTGGLDIVTNTTFGLVAINGGTINISGAGNTITATGAGAVNLGGVTTGVTFDTIASTGTVASTGIELANLAANSSFTVTGLTTLNNHGSAGVWISGTVTFGSNVTINFGAVDINRTAATPGSVGIFVEDIAQNLNLDFGAVGIGNATGATGAGLAVSNITGIGFDIDIASLDVDNVAAGVRVDNLDAGSMTVTGTTRIDDASLDSIVIINSAANATFTGLVTILNDGGANGDGVDLGANTGTYAFNGGVDITVNGAGAFGFRATTSGTVNIVDVGTTQITSNNGTALLINPTTVNMVLDSITSGGGTNGISLTQMSGSLTVGTVNIADSTGDGLFITGLVGTINLSSIAIDGSGDDGFQIDATTATGAVTISGGTIGNTTDPTGRGVFVNGGSGTITIDASIAKANAGKIVQVDSRSGGVVSFGGDLSVSGGLDNGLSFNNNTGGTTSFTAAGSVGIVVANANNALTVVNSAAHSISFAGASTLQTTGSGNAVDVSNGATLAFAGSAISASGAATGAALQADGGGTLTITGTGALSAGATATAVNLSGITIGASGVNFASTNKTAGGVSAVIMNTVSGSTTAAVNLGSGALNGGGTGPVIRIGDGAGTASTGGTAGLSYTGTISNTTGSGRTIDIQDRTAGAGNITLSGNITHTVAGQNGIFIDQVAAGTITFSGGTKSITSTTANAVSLTNNTGATIDFAGGGLAISTTSGTGFTATGGGTVNVTTGANQNTIGASSGTALILNGVTAGMTFASTTAGGGTNGISLTGMSGSLNVVGAVTIDNSTGDGLVVNASPGTVTFGSVSIDDVAGDGIDISGDNGNITISGGNIGGAGDDDPNGIGVDINGAAGDNNTITINAAVSKTTVGNIVEVTGRTAGTVSFGGNLSATGGVDNGIDVNNNSGTAVINFSGATKTLTTGGRGVDLQTNTGATINFTGGGLVINTTSGTGFNATGGGTVTVQGTGNTINSGTGTALNIANTNISAADVTFRSISSNGGSATGIVLDTTGSAGGLHVTGNGTAGSGGTIANKTGADGATTTGNGIYLNNTADVRLAWMQLNDFQNSAIRGMSVTGFSLEDSVINGTIGTNTGVIEGAIAFGDVLGGNGLFGNSLIDNVDISGSVEHHVEVYNQSGTMNLTISNSNIHDNSLTGGSDGIQMEFGGTAQAFVHIDNNQFSNNKSQAIQISALENSILNATISSNTITRGTQGNEGVVISNGGNADARVMIGGPSPAQGNTISGFGGVAIFVGQVPGQGTSSSLLEATIQNNTVVSPASATNHAILALVSSLTGQVSQARFLIDSNNVTYNSGAARAILVDAPDAGRTPEFHATVTNNVVTATDVNAVTMISVAARNGAIGHADVRGNDVNYTAAVGIVGVNVREATGGSIVLARGASGSNDSAVVLATNNPSSTTAILPGAGDVPVVENNTILLPGTPTLPSTPLLAAEGGVAAVGEDMWGDVLTGDTLDRIIAAAIDRWVAIGLTDEQLAVLNAATFEIADLGGNYLGLEGGSHIRIDDDGAGHGWFVDTTPLNDEEFANRVGETRMLADGTQAPAGQYDLLTTVMHEFGHMLGYGDTYAADQSSTLMYGWLQTGERRLPNVVYAPRGEYYSVYVSN